ncbi:MAG TPA: hypothetical protein VFP30_08680 [Candidatus Limnocylindria bacterium]|nr:hypothetical protein [Candidatus Limnocylindria bacterium]
MRRAIAALLCGALLLAACLPTISPSPSSPASAEPTGSSAPSPSASEAPTPAASATPAATPAPSLSLEPPQGSDDRVVAVDIAVDVPAGGDGTITVVVTSAADTRIDELVLRWPTELDESLFLAPFTPSDDRIRDGGPPLVQPWTKWVVGPGEHGEPAGTTSLGWGPLLAGAALEIPIIVTRREEGPLAFDLQLLSGEDLLTGEDGDPTQLRVEVP